jgi:hypothetical protein
METKSKVLNFEIEIMTSVFKVETRSTPQLLNSSTPQPLNSSTSQLLNRK